MQDVARKRIGLLTLPLNTNYGGILQALALYEYLTSAGNEVVFMERSRKSPLKKRLAVAGVKWLPAALFAPPRPGVLLDALRCRLAGRLSRLRQIPERQKQMEAYRHFIHALMPVRTGPLYSMAGMQEAVRRFGLDTLMVGSDQVWRLTYQPPGSADDYFLGFAGKAEPGQRLRRVSYAASFGVGSWTYPAYTARASALLGQFDAVSVREESGISICRDALGRGDAVCVLDPTLLVDPAFYERIAAPPSPAVKPVLLEYILDYNAQKSDAGRAIAGYLWSDYAVRTIRLGGSQDVPDVPGWVRAFMDADFVVTDSFHGMVFSIIFRKNFMAIVNHDRGADRFTSLLGLLGLEDRLIDSSAPEQGRALAAKPIDYIAVARKLEALRQGSVDFLARALA